MEDLIFALVVAARFLVPLAIPRFPLPAIVAALVIDAADQTIFAAFDVEPDNYQAYDKALDIYYLTIAYISTIRNWTDGVPFRTAQFLWYYRLVGVVAFELSGARALLLVFPNTFEYVFIFYEVVRLRWEPSNLSRRTVIGAAATIWIGIKLPQEWWIHIAQLDVTDVLGDHPWIWVALAAVATLAWTPLRRWSATLPSPDWPTSFDVDAHPTTVVGEPADPPSGPWAAINHPLVEKTLLVGLVTTIFLQLVPENNAGVVEVTLGVGVIVVASSFVSYWLALRGTDWTSTAGDFLGTGLINIGIVLALQLLPGRTAEGGPGVLLTLLVILLLTLIVTMYDRYRNLRLASLVPVQPKNNELRLGSEPSPDGPQIRE